MITQNEFKNLLFRANHSKNLVAKYHEQYEEDENLCEFVLTSKNLAKDDYIFILADNRLHIKTDLDFDCLHFLKGSLESIDGEELTICIYYDKKQDLLDDLEEMMSWYNSNS